MKMISIAMLAALAMPAWAAPIFTGRQLEVANVERAFAATTMKAPDHVAFSGFLWEEASGSWRKTGRSSTPSPMGRFVGAGLGRCAGLRHDGPHLGPGLCAGRQADRSLQLSLAAGFIISRFSQSNNAA